MLEIVAAFVGALLPIIIGGGTAYVTRRHDRSKVLQDLEILTKLNASSAEAGHVRDLVGRRVHGWRKRETSATFSHIAVTFGCLAVLYALAITAWVLRYYVRVTMLGRQDALSRGDNFATQRADLILAELAGVDQFMTTFVYIVVGLGLVHSALWLAQVTLNRRTWRGTTYEVPGADLVSPVGSGPGGPQSAVTANVTPGRHDSTAVLVGDHQPDPGLVRVP